MEPDQLNILRGKIHSLERQPVSWQKEFVWQQVTRTPNTRLFKIQWRYTAAVVLAGVIGYLFHFYQQRAWESATHRISALEKQIASAGNKPVISQNSKEETCIEEKNNIIHSLAHDGIVKNSSVPQELTVIAPAPISINLVDSLFTSITPVESVVSVEEKSPLKIIMPIIGKIPQNIPDRTGKERTVRIRLNKKDNPALPSPTEDRYALVARIN